MITNQNLVWVIGVGTSKTIASCAGNQISDLVRSRDDRVESINRLKEEEDLHFEETWIKFCFTPTGFGEEMHSVDICIMDICLVSNSYQNLFGFWIMSTICLESEQCCRLGCLWAVKRYIWISNSSWIQWEFLIVDSLSLGFKCLVGNCNSWRGRHWNWMLYFCIQM